MHIVFAVAVAIALTEVTVLATSVYLHRGLAHRSLKIHPAADVLFRTILWLTTGQSRQQWVAIHRKHHAFTDCEGDPHSPRLLGFWRGQRNYDNTARNSIVLAWVTGGESLHNNHHAHPRAPRFSVRGWEFDPSWPFIRALAAVGLLVIDDAPGGLARAPSPPLLPSRGAATPSSR